MPDDLNFKTRVSAVPDVDKGMGDIDRRFAKTRREMETPVRSKLLFDTASLDYVDRRLADLQKRMTKPMSGPRLPPLWDGTRRGNIPSFPDSGGRIDRERDMLRNSGFLPRSMTSAIPFKDDPIGLKPLRDAFSEEEKKVRDTMAAVIRGMERRAEADRKVADQAEAEAEARRRLGLSIPKPSPRPERQALREREQAIREGRLPGLTMAEANYRYSTYTPLSGRAKNGPNSMAMATRTGGRSIGGESGGFDIGGTRLKTEDKVNLGGGFKLLGQVGLAVAAAEIVGKGLQGIEQLSKDYTGKQKVGMGGARGVGEIAGERAADYLPAAGTLGRGFRHVFDREARMRQEVREKYAAQQDEAEARRRAQDAGIIESRQLRSDMYEQRLSNFNSRAFNEMNRNDPTGIAGERFAVAQNAAATNRALDRQLGGLIDNQSAGNPNRMANPLYEQAKAEIAATRADAQRKLIDDLAEVDRRASRIRADAATAEFNQRKANERDLFGVRQTMLETEGRTIRANLEAVEQAAKDARSTAYGREREITSRFGSGSQQSKDAQKTLAETLGVIDQRAGANRDAIMEQARRGAPSVIAEGLGLRAQFGDVGAAKEASDRLIEQATNERRRQLDNLISSNALDEANLAMTKRQRAELATLTEQQKKVARANLDVDEQRRRGAIAGTLSGIRGEELRRLAGRTGNQAYGIEADALGVGDAYRQRVTELRGQLANAKTDEERQGLQSAIDASAGQLRATIGDLTRSRVSSEDFMNASNATAIEAGGLRGYAQSAREDATATVARSTTNMEATLQKIADILVKNLNPDKSTVTPPAMTFNYKG